MSNPSQSVWPKKLTPTNLSYVLDGLDDGDSVTLTRREGQIEISIKTAGKRVASLDNRLSYALNSEPVHQGWMAYNEEATPKDRHIRSSHRKEIGKKVREADVRKNMLRSALLLELASMNMKQASLTKFSMSSYWAFEVGNYTVYTNSEKVPVMCKEGQKGEFIYL